jgi:WD40 repeat protein
MEVCTCSFILVVYEKNAYTAAEIILHDLQTQSHFLKFRGAHKGKISGLCFSGENVERLLSCGVDRNVKLWDVLGESDPDGEVSLI